MLHTPVLREEVVRFLAPHDGDLLLDGTVGSGGHAEALLDAAGPHSRLLGLDRDPAALERAAGRLQRFAPRIRLVQASFLEAESILAEQLPGDAPARILLDLGVSSLQLEESGRGFSFQRDDEPLDMRFDPSRRGTAADLLKSLPEQELARCIVDNGEEPLGRRIAHAIVLRRKTVPYSRVLDLVQTVRHVYGSRSRRSRTHPATRTFQALRIAVNDELSQLREALPRLVHLLPDGGRIAVISFHSLEDRIVKQLFKQESTDCICPPNFPECRCGHRASLTVLTRHVVSSSADERAANPRARSAKLRVAEKHQPS